MKIPYTAGLKRRLRSDSFISRALTFDVFICGAVVMALEITGGRILAPHFGSTIFVWGSLIGVVLAALSLGYFLGGKLSDRKASFATFSLIIFVAGISILLIPYLSTKISTITTALNLGVTYGPLVVTIMLLGIPSMLLGMVSPYAIKLKAKNIEQVGNIAGNLYSISTLGSIVGTFLTVFVLIPSLGVTQIIMSSSALLIIISLLGLRNKRSIIAGGFLLLFIIPSYTMIINNVFVGIIDEVKYEKIYEKDTLYYHLVVSDDRNPLHRDHERVLTLDSLHHSSMVIDDPAETTYIYPYYFHLGFVFNPEIKNVLFIGGGGFSAPKKFLKDYKDVNMDVVEIDPEVITVAKKYFNVTESSRLNIVNEDGRLFLAQSNKTYDLIVLDAYSGTYVPFHLMTKEFFDLINERLTPNGLVMSNLITSLEGDLSALFKSEYRTINQVFPNLYVFPTGNPIRYWSGNVILVATKDEKRLTKNDIVQIAEESKKIKIPKHTTYVENYWNEEIDTESFPVLTDDYAPANNLLNPVSGRLFSKE